MKTTLYQNVLVLNKHWIPVNICTVKKALEDMCSSKTPKKALRIEYPRTESGFDFSTADHIEPLDWDQWSELEPRPFDENCVRGTKKTYRVPRVIIATHYDKIPIKTFRPTKQTLYDLQKGRCAYTGEHAPFSSMSIDHVHPRSRGGGNHFDNLVLCRKEINSFKGDRTPEEAGLKLLIRNKAPRPVPAQMTIPTLFQDWKLFLH